MHTTPQPTERRPSSFAAIIDVEACREAGIGLSKQSMAGTAHRTPDDAQP